MKRATIIATVLAIGLAGCAGGSKVGDESLLDFDDKGAGRLGKISDSPSPTPTSKRTRKPKPSPSKTKTPEVQTREWPLAIAAEGYVADGPDPYSGGSFDGRNFRVFVGDTIRVTNRDTEPRSFTADDGSFDSGLLGPGKSWTYEARAAGVFNVSDSTRPFVVGKVEVVKRP